MDALSTPTLLILIGLGLGLVMGATARGAAFAPSARLKIMYWQAKPSG